MHHMLQHAYVANPKNDKVDHIDRKGEEMSTINCPHCGYMITGSTERCPNCRKLLETESNFDNRERLPLKKKIIMAVAIVIIIFFSFAVYMKSTEVQRARDRLDRSLDELNKTQQEIDNLQKQIDLNQKLIDSYENGGK